MLLGEQIQYIRRLKNMERKEVADRLGITVQQFANIENNVSHIDEERLERLSVIFNVDKERIREIDTERILHQINNDNSTGFNLVNTSTINLQDNEVVTKMLENQTKLMEMMDKRLNLIEDFIKGSPANTQT